MTSKETKGTKMRGMLAEHADNALRTKENEAFAAAMKKKHDKQKNS